MTELTLPAGSLQSALHAFYGGADAVYLGLSDYSARKHATNFSWEELAKVKTEATRLGKRIYITFNTLLDDREIDTTVQMLRRLELIQPDGIIVQDLGLSKLIRTQFPSLELHCSTQLAVHTVSGVRTLQQMGFKRIVLSRELTFKEIEYIRTSCPDVELKTFIHGAMCYGFSGLCMASHNLTGRSANRGECAQICRTWFSHPKGDGYFFSMTDLAAKEEVVRLRDIGIDSLKVEGRMKGPAYVRFAAEYYRMILDGNTDPVSLEQAHERLEAQFSRYAGAGWTFGYGKEIPEENRHTPSLVTSTYPEHVGTQIATVTAGRSPGSPTRIELRLERDIAIRDGLLWLSANNTGITKPVRFALQAINAYDGKKMFSAQAPTTVTIDVPDTVSASVGDPIYRISRHDLHVQTLQESSISPFRLPIDIEITLYTDSLQIHTFGLPAWFDQKIAYSYPLDVQEAKRPQDVIANLKKIFSSPNEGLVTLGNLTLDNQTTFSEERVFLPLSSLKDIRRDWYDRFNTILLSTIEQKRDERSSQVPVHTEILPPRKKLVSPFDPMIPWVDVQKANRLLDTGKPIEEILPIAESIAYISLPPVTFNEETLYVALDKLVARLPITVRVGLNNVGHIQWARRNSHIETFADIYLYMTNRLAVEVFLESVPKPIGLYRWVERSTQDTSLWPARSTPVGTDFHPPLFISRACYRYDALKLPCEGCPRNGSWKIEQSGKNYRVDVRNCLTVVSEEPEEE